MSELAAVACLSVAAKVEETQVPLLLDLQVEESKYGRGQDDSEDGASCALHAPMEDESGDANVVRRPHWEEIRVCKEPTLVILEEMQECDSFSHCRLIIDGKTYASADSRLVRYLPSVIAAATIIYAIREIGKDAAVEYEDQLMFVLRASKREIDDCLTLILEATGGLTRKSCCKRKFDSIPSSPSGVIEAYFSSESSVDSWAVAMSASSSPEPLFKRSKAISIGLANSTT